MMKIEQDNNWINYDVFHQNLWCITTDKYNHVWVGTGHDNPLESLIKFNGCTWNTENPRDNEGNVIECTVRKLVSDRDKIWVVSEKVGNMGYYYDNLLTYDGTSWTRINEVPVDDRIAEIVIDNFRNVAWIRMLNRRIIKVYL